MRAAYWTCLKIGCAIVAIPPAVLAGYMAMHPPPDGCRVECHWVIPPEEFRPGGELWVPPGGAVIVTPPRGWSRSWGSNTAPWPIALPPSAFWIPAVEVLVEQEDDDSPERCYRLKHEHCRHHVEVIDTPEPGSLAGLLTALLMLVGVRMAWRAA